MGITQSAPGATIVIADDTDATNHPSAPGPHLESELAALASGDNPELGTFEKSYRQKVSIQMLSTAPTSIKLNPETVIMDSGKTWTVSGAATNRTYLFGDKVGTGSRAGGRNGPKVVFGTNVVITGVIKSYGAYLRGSGILGLNPGSDDDGSEIMGSSFESMATTGNSLLIGGTSRFSSIYNIELRANTTGYAVFNFGAVRAEKVFVTCPTPSAFFRFSVPNTVIKDLAFAGTPTISDIRCSSGGYSEHLIRPTFTGLGPKFSADIPTIPNSTVPVTEYWIYEFKLVDYLTGSGIENIAVTVLDEVAGITIFDGLTDSAGRITFGTDLFQRAVAVADWYQDPPGAWTFQHHSPFRTIINSAAYHGILANSAYEERDYRWNWPGYPTVTLSSGNFEDAGDIVGLRPPQAVPPPVAPVVVHVDDVPVEADDVDRYIVKVEGEV